MHNWAGNLTYSASGFEEPTSTEQLQQLVASTARVKALGSRHSFSAVADTDGVAVGTRRLGTPCELDEATGVAVVPAGATYAEVGGFLQQRGRALHNLGSLPHISVAGACATGTHGSGAELGCLASAVRGLELVRADGELVHLGPDHPDLPGAALSLGALGVVTRVWLATEPTYDVAQRVVLDVPTATAVEHAVEILSAATSVSLFSTFASPERMDEVWFKQRVGADGWPAALDVSAWGGREATEPVHPIPGIDAAATTTQLGRPGAWLDRLPHFRIDHVPSVGEELQSEFLIPLERAGEALSLLHGLADRLVPVLQTHELRSIAADDLWLSPFAGRRSAAVHFTWISDIEVVRPVLAAVEDALAPLGARAHWGKVVSDDARWARPDHDGVARFRDLAARMDPERCFANPYLLARGVLAP